MGSHGDVTEEFLEMVGLTPDRPVVIAVEECAGRKDTEVGLETW